MHQVYLLVMQYALDNDGALPQCNEVNISTFRADWAAYDDEHPEESTLPSNKRISGNWLDHYMRSSNIPPDIWFCPSLMVQEPYMRIPERWMDEDAEDPTRNKSNNEFWIGMNYVGNPPRLEWPRNRGKFRQPWPVNVDTMTSADPIFFDYCIAVRPTPTDASDIDTWLNFPHLGIYKARFSNVIMGDGSLYRKPVEKMKLGYVFIKPHNIFW
jgi:hypothetical protein